MQAIDRVTPGFFLVAWLLLLLAGCNSGLTHPRASLFDLGPRDPVQAILAESARLTVVYWPASGRCLPREEAVVRALNRVDEQYADIRMLSVIKNGADLDRYGVSLPGKVVELDHFNYRLQMKIGPLPRVEVWDSQGRLLLLKSLPDIGDQAAALGEEIVFSRALTSPLVDPGIHESSGGFR